MTNGVWRVEFDGEWSAPAVDAWNGQVGAKSASVPTRFDYDLWAVTDGATTIYAHSEREANALLERLGAAPL